MLDTRVKDWTSERHGAPVELTYRTLWLSFAVFFALAAAIWLTLFALSKSFPFIQNGAAAVAQEKLALAQNPKLFAPTDKIRVVAFGNSKTLAGFRPSAFGPALGPGADAANLAIPGDDRFLDLLETQLSHGAAPTHVFLQSLPRSSEQDDSLWSLLLDNKRLGILLFPFRPFVRDAIIFAYESRRVGPFAQYRSNAAQIEQMRAERGYYFIKSQSHYADDRLPEGYSLPTDRPDQVSKRDIDPSDPQFRRLMDLAEKYNFEVMLVPIAYRRGEYAEPPAVDEEAAAVLKSYPRAHVIGPAYWIYELQDFSDPVHLNIPGAERYSKQLAALFQGQLASRH